MTILITGGCGFLGSNLAASALARGHEVALLDNLSRAGSDANLRWLRSLGELRFVETDIRDADAVAGIVAETQPDAIFHLAGQVAMTTSIADPRADFEVNAGGTLNLLEAVRRHSEASVVLYSSTNKVYGDLDWVEYDETPTRYVAPRYPDGFPETIPFSPSSPYGISKAAADLYAREYTRLYGTRTVVFRHSSMYGARQFATVDQGWVGWFCARVLETLDATDAPEITVAGSGKQVRDLLHADDLAELYFSAIERADEVAGSAFNIGGGMANSMSILELLDHVSHAVGASVRTRSVEPRFGDQKVFVADNASATRAFGWSPAVDAATGLRRMIEWVRDSGATPSASA